MSFFKPVTDAEGNTTYVEMTEDEIAELVKGSPLYTTVLNESIERRQKIKALKDQLAEKPEDEVPPPVPTPAPVVDETTLVEKILTQLTERQQAAQQAEAERQQKMKAILAKHGLGENALPVLLSSADPEGTAAYLAQSSFRFDDAQGGETSTPSDVETAVAAMYKKLNLGD